MNKDREDNIYYARLAEQGERYEDMIRYMKEVAGVSALSRPSGIQVPRHSLQLAGVCSCEFEMAAEFHCC